MKKLNFLPKYKNWILEGKKFRTVRLGNDYIKKFKVGDKIEITIADDLKNAQKIAEAEITELVLKKIKEVRKEEVIGDPEAWPKSSLVSILNEIYSKRIGRKVKEDDYVTIIKFRVIK
ncbi:MAG: ASCH domain-containing protein [Candidatus Aenigmatarchaeota archaeon]